MKILKNRRRLHKVINNLRFFINQQQKKIILLEDKSTPYILDLHQRENMLLKSNEFLRKENEELLHIKDKYYKLLAAIKINEKH